MNSESSESAPGEDGRNLKFQEEKVELRRLIGGFRSNPEMTVFRIGDLEAFNLELNAQVCDGAQHPPLGRTREGAPSVSIPVNND